MPVTDTNLSGPAFAAELERRFDELTRWALANWPDGPYAASQADFAAARKNIDRLRAMHDPDQQKGEQAEPAQGGAQYLDVSPTPWP